MIALVLTAASTSCRLVQMWVSSLSSPLPSSRVCEQTRLSLPQHPRQPFFTPPKPPLFPMRIVWSGCSGNDNDGVLTHVSLCSAVLCSCLVFSLGRIHASSPSLAIFSTPCFRNRKQTTYHGKSVLYVDQNGRSTSEKEEFASIGACIC